MDCQSRLPGANSANQLCAFEGRRANHLAHNHGALTTTDRLVHGGARNAETQKTNTQCYATTSPSCLWPPSARRSSFCDLHSGCGHIGAQRSSLARFVVSSASLPRPRGYLRQSGFASTARRPGAHRCTGASRTEDDRLRTGKGNGKTIARPKGPPSGMSLSEKDISASCPKARAACRCHKGCNYTVGSPKRGRATAVASGVNVPCGRQAASC